MNWMHASAEEIVNYIRSCDDPLCATHLALRLERGERIDQAINLMMAVNQRLLEQNHLLNITMLATPPSSGDVPYRKGN